MLLLKLRAFFTHFSKCTQWKIDSFFRDRFLIKLNFFWQSQKAFLHAFACFYHSFASSVRAFCMLFSSFFEKARKKLANSTQMTPQSTQMVQKSTQISEKSLWKSREAKNVYIGKKNIFLKKYGSFNGSVISYDFCSYLQIYLKFAPLDHLGVPVASFRPNCLSRPEKAVW